MLHPDWKLLARRAWSFRLTVLGAAFGGLEMALPLFSDAVPRGAFLGLSLVATVGGAIARLVAQPRMGDGR
jgi:hypothetical protein